jgi:hypothetical protein
MRKGVRDANRIPTWLRRELEETEIARFINVRQKKSLPNSDKQSSAEHPNGQGDQCKARKKKYYTEAYDHLSLKSIAQCERHKSAGRGKLWQYIEKLEVIPEYVSPSPSCKKPKRKKCPQQPPDIDTSDYKKYISE